MLSLRAGRLVLLIMPILPFLVPGEIPGEEMAAGPTFLLDISKEFLGAAVEQTVDRTEPVYDVILKTRISGVGHTVGKVRVELIPSDREGIVDLLTTGTTTARTVGVNGPVQIYSDGTVPFQIRQRIYLRGDGVRADYPRAHAEISATLTGITTDFKCLLDRLVKRIACRQYRKNKDEANAIAKRRAEYRLNQGVQAEAGPKLQEADQSLKKTLADLRSGGVPLASPRFRTTKDLLSLRAGIEGAGRPKAPPPPLGAPAYLVLRVHETMTNDTARVKLAGKTFTGDELEKAAENFNSGGKPAAKDDTDWSVTFAMEKPLLLTFADKELTALMRLAKFTSGDTEYKGGTDVTVKYRFKPAGDKVKAVRQGPIEAFPPGFKPGKKLSGPQQVMRTVIQRRFGRFLKEEIELSDLELADDLKKAGPLTAVRVEPDQGWLLVAWKKGK
jgi:hypothetical protein